MGDLAYLLLLVAFFGSTLGLVRLCEWIVGRDEITSAPARPGDDCSCA